MKKLFTAGHLDLSLFSDPTFFLLLEKMFFGNKFETPLKANFSSFLYIFKALH